MYIFFSLKSNFGTRKEFYVQCLLWLKQWHWQKPKVAAKLETTTRRKPPARDEPEFSEELQELQT